MNEPIPGMDWKQNRVLKLWYDCDDLYGIHRNDVPTDIHIFSRSQRAALSVWENIADVEILGFVSH